MPQPTGADLHIDTYLSNLGIAYMNEPSSYIATQVFPVVLTNKQSDLYPIYAKDYWFRDEAEKRAPLTESKGGGYELEDPGTFYAHEWAFHKDIPDEDIWNADDVFDLEDDALAFTIEKLRLGRERRWAAAYFGTGVWGNDLVGGTDFTAWSTLLSTPIDDIDSAKALIRLATGLMPNTLVVAERVHQTLKNHASVLDRFKYTQTGIITEKLLAQVFEVERYVKASAIYATNKEGDTENLEYILNENDALLVYAAPRPSKRSPSGGYTFRWNRPIQAGRTGERLETTVRKMRLELIAGERVEGSVYEDIKLVASSCGVFFSEAIEVSEES